MSDNEILASELKKVYFKDKALALIFYIFWCKFLLGVGKTTIFEFLRIICKKILENLSIELFS